MNEQPSSSAKHIRIAIVGDSTVADYPPSDLIHGWGQLLPEFLTRDVTVRNFAVCGESSKSFIKKGLWKSALDYHADYYLIQFGHNDCPGKGDRSTDPNTDYRQYLTQYVNDVRGIGAVPVLVTSMERRNFNPDGTVRLTLNNYVDAMKAVGASLNVPVLDLNKWSIALYEKLGDKESSYLMSLADRTHFTEAGAREMASIVASELCLHVPELDRYNLKCSVPNH